MYFIDKITKLDIYEIVVLLHIVIRRRNLSYEKQEYV